MCFQFLRLVQLIHPYPWGNAGTLPSRLPLSCLPGLSDAPTHSCLSLLQHDFADTVPPFYSHKTWAHPYCDWSQCVSCGSNHIWLDWGIFLRIEAALQSYCIPTLAHCMSLKNVYWLNTFSEMWLCMKGDGSHQVTSRFRQMIHLKRRLTILSLLDLKTSVLMLCPLFGLLFCR